jgi:hypothetical protein
MMLAKDIATKAAELVAGDREATHGDKFTNFTKIALLWNAWLCARRGIDTNVEDKPLDAHDIGIMMVLMKAARTLTGSTNPDDYIDMAGYAACAAEVKR